MDRPRSVMDDLWDELDAYRHPVDDRTRWAMGRAAYDRLRAVLVTEDQERARAQAHASAWVSVFSRSCPACPSGPFDTPVALTAHMDSMADAANREPHEGDRVLGIRIEVRGGAGEPRLQQLTATADGRPDPAASRRR